jgi:hypothetical protein
MSITRCLRAVREPIRLIVERGTNISGLARCELEVKGYLGGEQY